MRRRLAVGALLLAAAGFVTLGAWQVERRDWKLRLIAAVEARVHAPPVAAPGPERWRGVTAEDDAYRHVRVAGAFEQGKETRVQAVTERGPGFWLLAPLRTSAGWTVLVNRGFIPADTMANEPAGAITVTGLLRITEPSGGFLRANDPAANRWYSRDVAAIARARGLGRVAPYFIDADAGAGGYPVGGLTVIAFRNNHLIYALTWVALAGLSSAGAWRVLRER